MHRPVRQEVLASQWIDLDSPAMGITRIVTNFPPPSGVWLKGDWLRSAAEVPVPLALSGHCPQDRTATGSGTASGARPHPDVQQLAYLEIVAVDDGEIT
ncbi:MAG: hypothetical protein KF696_00850 [Planctomycetes bacterium]|nr:hypothetical protein [Planctomycetota bacterium]MCW8134513.1 hypothetical protein [Planctomycetota bacterium]